MAKGENGLREKMAPVYPKMLFETLDYIPIEPYVKGKLL
jgi:hypothetical protein